MIPGPPANPEAILGGARTMRLGPVAARLSSPTRGVNASGLDNDFRLRYPAVQSRLLSGLREASSVSAYQEAMVFSSPFRRLLICRRFGSCPRFFWIIGAG